MPDGTSSTPVGSPSSSRTTTRSPAPRARASGPMRNSRAGALYWILALLWLEPRARTMRSGGERRPSSARPSSRYPRVAVPWSRWRTSSRSARSASAASRSLLLAWYDKQGEPFPWRDARNPYWALVAGVCSQQTPMSRVHPLWQRWIEAFPTVDAAARAERAQALRGWGDAGYPRRAVHLHEAAHRCEAEHGGRVPSDEAALLALPGVGPFTAAIVRSFGYGEDAPAVDTNVVRVIGRLVHGDLQPARETPPAALAASARRLLRPGTAARWNPALMDHGARVCRPLPRCEACAVAGLCAARPRFAAGQRAAPLRAQAAVRRLRPPVAGTDPRGPAARRGPAAHGAAGPRARPQRRGADNGATPARRPLRGGTRLAARRKLRPREAPSAGSARLPAASAPRR